jgi:hypothetical protein
MNVKTLREIFFFLAAFLFSVAPFLLVSMTDQGKSFQAMNTFMALLGAGTMMVFAHIAVRTVYIKTVMRLDGFRDGSYAVLVRVYYNGRIYPSEESPLMKVDESEDLKALACVQWAPLQGHEETRVVVLGHVYEI